METIANFPSRFLTVLSCLAVLLLASCNDDDDPQPEEVPETITLTVLTFTPANGGAALVYQAEDEDGEGPGDIIAEDITLNANTTYNLTVNFYNGLLEETDEEYDITEEVEEEGDEHQIFFEWNPATLIDGQHAYNDEDENGLPIGLSTTLTTGDTGQSGSLKVVLKHQPGIKSANSGINDGESDVEVTFDVMLQ